jgi:hypothetical protein
MGGKVFLGILLIALAREDHQRFVWEDKFGIENDTASDERIRCLDVASVYLNWHCNALILEVLNRDQVDSAQVGVGLSIVLCFLKNPEEVCRGDAEVCALQYE